MATALAVGRMAAGIAEFSALYEEYVVDSQPVLCAPASEHPTADAFEEEEEELRRIVGDSAPNCKAVVAAADLLSDEEGAAVLDARLRCLPAAEYTETPKQRDLTEREAEVYDLAFGGDVAAALGVLGDIEGRMSRVANIYERALAIPREEHHAACRELLKRMGVPIVFARVPYEAEGLCAAMALSGLVDFAGTEDSDVVAYGVSPEPGGAHSRDRFSRTSRRPRTRSRSSTARTSPRPCRSPRRRGATSASCWARMRARASTSSGPRRRTS